MNSAANKYIPAEITKAKTVIGQTIIAIMELLIFLRKLITNNFKN